MRGGGKGKKLPDSISARLEERMRRRGGKRPPGQQELSLYEQSKVAAAPHAPNAIDKEKAAMQGRHAARLKKIADRGGSVAALEPPVSPPRLTPTSQS